MPWVRNRYVAYGSRTPAQKPGAEEKKSILGLIVDLPAYPVPHWWFLHYYILSVSMSVLWGYQIFTRGSIVQWLARRAPGDIPSSMPLSRVYLLWALMGAQGCRRLYESVYYMKPSKSTMPLSIYLIGIAYYLMVSVGVWIEGSAALLASKPPSLDSVVFNIANWTPSLRTALGLPLFIIASGIQRDCHVYLASLPKYTLPDHPVFHRIVCPHYTAECIIYASLAVLGAPKGQTFNKTVLSILGFVTVNLGLIAKRTRTWSMEKFGSEKVAERWCMIPGVW